MKIAIMQPTFLPWIGYFGMIHSVEKFVFLDNVQFAKRSWQQRNRIKSSQGELMLSLPIMKKGLRDQLISEAQINQTDPGFMKILASLKQNYSKAKYFDRYFPALQDIFQNTNGSLRDFNIDLIVFFCKELGIDTGKFLNSSDLNCEGTKTELLSNISSKLGGDCYISAPGSKDYIEAEIEFFSGKGIRVEYFNYEHPSYPQLYGDFLPYMSIADLVFNCGDSSLDIILGKSVL